VARRPTLSRGLQRAAETAVADAIARLRRPGLQAALVALDPHSGDLLAIVGGADYDTSTRTTAPCSRAAKPGSAFKPLRLRGTGGGTRR
jgi:penicillin-binding protein 1B